MALSILATIKHRFQTAKPQRVTADVSRNEWNDSEVVASAALNGAAAVRDSAQPDGWGFQNTLRVFPLGGSREMSLPLAVTVQNATNYIDIEIDKDLIGALVVRLRVEVRTEDAGTSITPELFNVTDATINAVGTAVTATDEDYTGVGQVQNFVITLDAGVKKYRLRGTPGNADRATYLIGYLQIGG